MRAARDAPGDQKVTSIYFEDLEEGAVRWGSEQLADREEMLAYARRNDPWPFHLDDEAAKLTPFGGLSASGGYIVTLWYRSMSSIWHEHGESWGILAGYDWHLRFTKPVRPGDRLRDRWTLLSKSASGLPGRGVWTCRHEMINQHDEVVMWVEALSLVAHRPKEGDASEV